MSSREASHVESRLQVCIIDWWKVNEVAGLFIPCPLPISSLRLRGRISLSIKSYKAQVYPNMMSKFQYMLSRAKYVADYHHMTGTA
jgi:hypothetical protein